MKVFVTKYALTQGILEKDVEKTETPTMVADRSGYYTAYYHKPYWHLTKEDAIAHAEVLRSRKIASLEKSIKRIKGIKF